VKARFAPTTVTPTVADFALSGSYALVTWRFGKGFGSAALAKNGATWSALGMGGGQMDADLLEGLGIPTNIAVLLVAHLSPQPSPSP